MKSQPNSPRTIFEEDEDYRKSLAFPNAPRVLPNEKKKADTTPTATKQFAQFYSLDNAVGGQLSHVITVYKSAIMPDDIHRTVVYEEFTPQYNIDTPRQMRIHVGKNFVGTIDPQPLGKNKKGEMMYSRGFTIDEDGICTPLAADTTKTYAPTLLMLCDEKSPPIKAEDFAVIEKPDEKQKEKIINYCKDERRSRQFGAELQNEIVKANDIRYGYTPLFRDKVWDFFASMKKGIKSGTSWLFNKAKDGAKGFFGKVKEDGVQGLMPGGKRETDLPGSETEMRNEAAQKESFVKRVTNSKNKSNWAGLP